MKFYSVAISVIAIITAVFGAMIMAYQEQYFRGYLLALFIVIQVDVLAIRMHTEKQTFDPLNGLRKYHPPT